MTATVSPGSDPGYLMSAVGRGAEHYYLKAIEVAGEPAGIWLGEGAADLGLSGEVDHDVMGALYSKFTDPRRLEESRTVTAERWAAFREEHPEIRPGTPEYRSAKAAVEAEVQAEYRLGSKIRDYTQSTEKRVEEALAKLGEDATPEQRRAAELKARQTAPQNRMYYDVTFSAPKSWSLYHASLQVRAAEARDAGDLEAAERFAGQADQVWAAWMEGVEAGLQHLQTEAGYAREGRFGGRDADGQPTGRRVDAHDWTIAAFRQHTSRDSDPQLHVHCAILNRVEAKSVDPVTGEVTGKWLAIDGKGIYENAKAAGHVSERVAEEALTRRLEVRFATRPDGVAREILGVDQELRDQFSSRRRTVQKGVAELAAAYEATHGRAPGSHELAKMAQFVVLDSRKGKEEAVSREKLLERWEAAAVTEVRTSLADLPEKVAEAAAEHGIAPVAFDPAVVVQRAVEQVQNEKAVFTRADLVVEVARQLPDCLGGLEAHQVTQLVGELADAALSPAASTGVVQLTAPELIPVPPELQRANGESVYSRHGSTRYATEAQLQREEQIYAAATRGGAPVVSREVIDAALASGHLNDGQAAAFRSILGSGRVADLVVGPAGAGKSRLNAAIHDTWKQHVGPVLGLTVSQRAAEVLRGEGVEHATNLAEFLTANELMARGAPVSERLQALKLQPGQLVMVDEASMAETGQLHEVRRLVEQAGAKLVMSGDHQQLSAVGAGGIFEQMATELPNVHVLDQVVRFKAEWEREASLRLRDGDTAVLAEYDDRGRLRSGSREAMLDMAYQDWLADTLAGRDSILIAASKDQVDELAARARAALVRLGRVEAGGIELEQRGITVGVGDQIQLRNNDRTVTSGQGRHAVNRDVVKVVGRTEDGALTVEYPDGDRMQLPPQYVGKYVDLAYAGTVHAAQGRTVDVCRTLVDGAGGRESFYVAMTRGREMNTAYVVTEQPGVPADQQPDMMGVLRQSLDNATAEQSATSVLRAELDRAAHLDRWTTVLEDLQTEDAARRYGQVLHDALGPEAYQQVRYEEGFASLLRLARSAEAAGHDAEQLLTNATERDLSDADQMSSVLHWRLEQGIEAADRAQVRADERQVREAVEAQERTVTGLVGELQVQQPADAAEQAALEQFMALQQVEVLHFGQEEQRRAELADQRRQEAEERARWDVRVQQIPGGRGEYARAAAELMESRRLELGRQLADAEVRPQWAERLGPVPTEERAHQAWIDRAGSVAAYREAHGYSTETDPIGPRPGRGAVDARTDWDRAFRALGEPEERRDLVGASDAQLRELVARYEREEAWAPRYVADQLREAHVQVQDLKREVAQRHIEAMEAAADPERRENLQRQAESLVEMSETLTDKTGKLEEIHAARTAWHEHTTETRERAQGARRQLELRAPQQEPEQFQPEQQADAPAQFQQVQDLESPVREAEQLAAQARGQHQERALDGEELDAAVDQARQARGILADREAAWDARQEQLVAEARAEERDVEHVRTQAPQVEPAQVVEQAHEIGM